MAPQAEVATRLGHDPAAIEVLGRQLEERGFVLRASWVAACPQMPAAPYTTRLVLRRFAPGGRPFPRRRDIVRALESVPHSLAARDQLVANVGRASSASTPFGIDAELDALIDEGYAAAVEAPQGFADLIILRERPPTRGTRASAGNEATLLRRMAAALRAAGEEGATIGELALMLGLGVEDAVRLGAELVGSLGLAKAEGGTSANYGLWNALVRLHQADRIVASASGAVPCPENAVWRTALRREPQGEEAFEWRPGTAKAVAIRRNEMMVMLVARKGVVRESLHMLAAALFDLELKHVCDPRLTPITTVGVKRQLDYLVGAHRLKRLKHPEAGRLIVLPNVTLDGPEVEEAFAAIGQEVAAHAVAASAHQPPPIPPAS